MPSFCGSCGSPADGRSAFCSKCGTRTAVAAPAPLPAVPVAPKKKRSLLKWIVVAVGVLFVFAALSVAGLYFAARRYVAMAENVTGVKAGDVVSSIRDAAARSSQGATEGKRDGCLLLSQEEASSILGVQVERVDGKPSDRESGEHCDFFVKPQSVEENLEKLKRAVSAVKNAPGDAPKSDQLPAGSNDMLKTLNRGAIEAARNGDAPYFGFTVERENGKIAFSAFQIANRLGGGDIGQSPEPLDIGDKAAMGMADSRMSVVKNNTAITLDLSQVTNARTRGIELMRVILPRL